MGNLISSLLLREGSARVGSGGVPHLPSRCIARLPRLIKACLCRLRTWFPALFPLLWAIGNRAYGATVAGARRAAVAAVGGVHALILFLMNTHLSFFCLVLFCAKFYGMYCLTSEELESYSGRGRFVFTNVWVFRIFGMVVYALLRPWRNLLAVHLLLLLVAAVIGVEIEHVLDLFAASSRAASTVFWGDKFLLNATSQNLRVREEFLALKFF